MTERFSLRFESGDRRGEVVGIPRGGLTVGRKPGNSLLILDNSISGKHAEITVEPEGVLLKDLGSTNGTRIGEDRILEQRLADGDAVVFGNVRLVFRDVESAGPDLEGEFDDLPVAHAPSAPVAPVDALERVSSDMVQRARQRSPAAAIGLGVAVLAAAGVGAWLWFGRSSADGARFAAVEDVPGNLLSAGYSFEGDRDTWEPVESAPAAFLVNGAARHAGAQGARADLAPGEWALHRSPTVRAGAERELHARAVLRTRGATEARLGVEFLPAEVADALPAPITAWAAPVRESADFTDSSIVAAVPPGYASARVVVLARAIDADQGGFVDADDVSVVESPAPSKPAAEVHGAALHLLGDPPISAQLVRVDRVLATGIEFTRADAAPGRDGARLSASAEGPRIVLEAQGADRPTQLVMRAERALAGAGIATLGQGGYQTVGATQERPGVESLLLGRAPDLVRVDLPAPCTVRGESDGSAVRLVVELGKAEPRVSLQLDFSADKGAAEDLAHAALAAEKKGELGGAIAKWGELLSRFPYESKLVDDAETTRTKLVQQGLAEVRVLSADAERARFFKLPGMFATTRGRAITIAERFAGSEVEADARELAQALEQEVAALRQDEDRAERARLTAMLGVLEKRGSTGIAAELRARLAKLEGGG